MRSAPKDKYLSGRPALLCSGKSRIEALNSAAEMTGGLFVGGMLSQFMSPADALKFEAAAKYVFSLPPLIFPVALQKGYSHAAAYFEELLGRRFAVVVLYRTKEECLADTENDDFSPAAATPMVEKLIDDLLQFPEDDFILSGMTEVFRCDNAAENAIRKIAGYCDFFDCDLYVEHTGQGMADLSAYACESHILALGLALFSVNDLSSDRKVYVKIIHDSYSPVISFTTKTQRADIMPTSENALNLCEYIAGCGGCVLSVNHREKEFSVTLSGNTKIPPESEFKCPLSYDSFEKCCKRTAELYGILLSDNKQ